MGSRVRVPPRSPSKIRHFSHLRGSGEKPCVGTVLAKRLPPFPDAWTRSRGGAAGRVSEGRRLRHRPSRGSQTGAPREVDSAFARVHLTKPAPLRADGQRPALVYRWWKIAPGRAVGRLSGLGLVVDRLVGNGTGAGWGNGLHRPRVVAEVDDIAGADLEVDGKRWRAGRRDVGEAKHER